MNDQPPSDAAKRIGVGLAADVTYFAPGDSKNFDPVSIAIALGGLLLGAFFKGVITELESGAESAGQRVGRWLRQRVAHLFGSEQPPEVQDDEDDERGDGAAAAAARAYENASQSERRRAIEAARATLE